MSGPGWFKKNARILACCFIWMCATLNDVACYNPYAYSARFLPNTMSANAYSAMGDIDWSKRSYGRVHDLLDRSFGYGSMADADWGWKKRSDQSFDVEGEDVEPQAEALLSETPKRAPYVSKSYKYRQPYMLARYQRNYMPYQPYARYGAISRPQTRKNGNRQYSYASMADMDWGWKKRSQLPALLEIEDDGSDAIENNDIEKKNVAFLAKTNSFPVGHSLSSNGKRSADDIEEPEEPEEINEIKRHLSSLREAKRHLSSLREIKRHISSLNRNTRSAISSLARNGSLRPTAHRY